MAHKSLVPWWCPRPGREAQRTEVGIGGRRWRAPLGEQGKHWDGERIGFLEDERMEGN